jgi:two-component system sensor histidine kinase DesK
MVDRDDRTGRLGVPPGHEAAVSASVDECGRSSLSGYSPVDDLPFRRGWIRFFWLAFLVIPILQIAGTDPTWYEATLQGLGLLAWFAMAFHTMRLPMVEGRRVGPMVDRPWLWIGGMLGITAALALFGVSSWSILFPGVAAYSARVAPEDKLIPTVLVITAVGAACSLTGGPWNAVSVGAICLGIGLMMSMIRVTVVSNAKLRLAQDELARLAVADERLRFARDMHDLVGHSLSVIALKAELAQRLVDDRPADAERHVREIEGVAREALTEVREVVSGYRRPLLEAELAGARMALDAAGIELALEQPAPLDLAPVAEAVLAWTVREGTTNVIRHSGARHCTIAVREAPEGAVVEVADDGRGCDGGNAGGNGLEGLRERAAEVAGDVDAGVVPGGGFRLRVTVPAARPDVPIEAFA